MPPPANGQPSSASQANSTRAVHLLEVAESEEATKEELWEVWEEPAESFSVEIPPLRCLLQVFQAKASRHLPLFSKLQTLCHSPWQVCLKWVKVRQRKICQLQFIEMFAKSVDGQSPY